MNAIASLNLASHDDGIAAICTFPVALDWLSIASPGADAAAYGAAAASSTTSALTAGGASVATVATAGPTTQALPPPPPVQQPSPPPPQQSAHPASSALPAAAPQPATATGAGAPGVSPPPAPPPPPPPHPALPPRRGAAASAGDPITKRQAASALVRHLRPYSKQEVLAPCFRVASRFILGRVLGTLLVPSELGLPHLASEPCADARFVLDLQHASIVETRHYAGTNTLLCIAYAAKRAEFVSLPPAHFARVEISYQRDVSSAPGGAGEGTSGEMDTHSQAQMQQQQEQQQREEPPELERLFGGSGRRRNGNGRNGRDGGTGPEGLGGVASRVKGRRRNNSGTGGEGSGSARGEIEGTRSVGRVGGVGGSGSSGVGGGPVRQLSWQEFCMNYGGLLPTGPLTATITCEPGGGTAVLKKESIIVTMNDPFAMTFSRAYMHLRSHTPQAKRIAPRRLLPRPTP